MERPKIRIGKDFTVLWNIYKRENGVKTPYMLAAGKENYVLRLWTPYGKQDITRFDIDENTIQFDFLGKDQKHLGNYSLELVERKNAIGMVTVDTAGFTLVAYSRYETDGGDSDVVIQDVKLESELGLTPMVSLTIDTELSETSHNAVSNYVITEKFKQVDDKIKVLQDAVETLDIQSIETAIENKADKSSVPTKTSQLTNDSGFITAKEVPAPDWNASTYKEGHIKNRTHHMQDYMCHYFNGSPIKISKPSDVGYVLLTYDTDLPEKFIRIEIKANESKTEEFLDSMGMPLIFTWDAGNSTINVQSFGGAIETYGMRAYYSSSAKGYDEYFVALDEGFIPEKVARKSEIKTINGQSILGEGDIEIKGGSSTFVTDFTVNDLYELVYRGAHPVQANIVALQRALENKERIVVPYGTEEYKGYSILQGYYEDLVYFTVADENGSTYVVEVGYDAGEIDRDNITHVSPKDNKINIADLQNGKVNKTDVATINGKSIINGGNITIEGGEGSLDSEVVSSTEASEEFPQVLYVEQTLTEAQKSQARKNIGADNTELKEQITELSAEIDEVKENFEKEVIYIPDITGVLTGAFLSSDGNISANQYGWAVRYQYIEQDCEVSYKASKVGNIGAFISDSIPVIGKKYDLIGFGNTALLEGTIAVQSGSYFCSTYNTEATTNYVDITARYVQKSNYSERLGKIETETQTFRQATLASSYFLGNRLIDTMTRTRWHNSTDTKIGNFTPVSATADTITLSAEDAVCISRIVILACELQDKSCEFVYFSAASGNIITKIYDFGENVDCRDIVKMQSLHDTTEGAYGIHLSPLGYRAMAKDIYRQSQQLRQFSDVRFCGGWTAQFCKGAADYKDTKVVDSYDNIVCEPLLNGVLTGGSNVCGMVFSRGIGNTINARTCYEVTQSSPNGATITFPIKAHYGFKGFVRVVCGREMDSAGLVVMSIKSSGRLVKSIDVPKALDSFVIELNDKVYDAIEVEFSLPSAALTKFKILEMTLHETYVVPSQYRPIDSSAIVAFLGSSNTQFPSLQVAESLCPSDAANAIVTRPDGSTGDGCGFLPKELARLSGAVVDNWGKSGEKTAYGLEKIASILQHKRYTHIVISLFGNDLNAGAAPSDVITNIRRMCEYARGCGCIPVVLQGYGSESTNEANKYALMYDALTQGFDSPFVYTNSALHNG